MAHAARLVDERLLTQDEAASVLGLTNPRTLAQWRLRRKGPAYIRVGHCVRYRRVDLEAYIAVNRVDPTAPIEIADAG